MDRYDASKHAGPLSSSVSSSDPSESLSYAQRPLEKSPNDIRACEMCRILYQKCHAVPIGGRDQQSCYQCRDGGWMCCDSVPTKSSPAEKEQDGHILSHLIPGLKFNRRKHGGFQCDNCIYHDTFCSIVTNRRHEDGKCTTCRLLHLPCHDPTTNKPFPDAGPTQRRIYGRKPGNTPESSPQMRIAQPVRQASNIYSPQRTPETSPQPVPAQLYRLSGAPVQTPGHNPRAVPFVPAAVRAARRPSAPTGPPALADRSPALAHPFPRSAPTGPPALADRSPALAHRPPTGTRQQSRFFPRTEKKGEEEERKEVMKSNM